MSISGTFLRLIYLFDYGPPTVPFSALKKEKMPPKSPCHHGTVAGAVGVRAEISRRWGTQSRTLTLRWSFMQGTPQAWGPQWDRCPLRNRLWGPGSSLGSWHPSAWISGFLSRCPSAQRSLWSGPATLGTRAGPRNPYSWDPGARMCPGAFQNNLGVWAFNVIFPIFPRLKMVLVLLYCCHQISQTR